ncbi:MAG: condensation domain-containing protein, partial [Bacteroidota bacterium]
MNFYELTLPQENIYYDNIQHPDTPLYTLSGLCSISGDFNIELFKQSIAILVERTDAFRTVFCEIEGRPFQKILGKEEYSFDVPIIDFSGEQNPYETALKFTLESSLENIINDNDSLLFEFRIFILGNNSFAWMVKYHHLIMDSYAQTILSRKAAEIYNSFLKKRSINEVEFCQYSDFVKDDLFYRKSGEFEADRQYWLNAIGNPPELIYTLTNKLSVNSKQLKIHLNH